MAQGGRLALRRDGSGRRLLLPVDQRNVQVQFRGELGSGGRRHRPGRLEALGIDEPGLGRPGPAGPDQRDGGQQQADRDPPHVVGSETGVAVAAGILADNRKGQIDGIERNDSARQEGSLRRCEELEGRDPNNAQERQGDHPGVSRTALHARVIPVQEPNGHHAGGVQRQADPDDRVEPPAAAPKGEAIALVSLFDPVVVPVVGHVDENDLLENHKDSRPQPGNPQIKGRKERVRRNRQAHQQRDPKERVLGRPGLPIEGGNNVGGHRVGRKKQCGQRRRAVDPGIASAFLQDVRRGVRIGCHARIVPGLIDPLPERGGLPDPVRSRRDRGANAVLEPQRRGNDSR
mmetsp:Transcript_5057/g.14655  ORF Transcript_5057/g.14655 Transcript_5057/m.14655 type:complete len:346 (+) Transcript_5057:382-1419(+)